MQPSFATNTKHPTPLHIALIKMIRWVYTEKLCSQTHREAIFPLKWAENHAFWVSEGNCLLQTLVLEKWRVRRR